MRRWLLALTALLLGASALASSLVVYPFDSQDTLLGVAVADRVAASFEGSAQVIGPDTAPGLVPPLVAQGGFVNLVSLLGTASMTGPSGATLLRGMVGADVAVTGSIGTTASGYRLDLVIASAAGMRRVALDAPKDAPGRLAVQAAGAVGAVLGATPVAVAPALDLTGPYGAYVRALTLVSAGLPQDAANVLDQAAAGSKLSPRAQRLADDLQAVLNGGAGKDPVRVAVASLSLPKLDEARSVKLFEAMQRATGLPVADVWIGALDSNVNDKQAATAAFDRAAAAYPFGRAARAAFRNERGSGGADADIEAVLNSQDRNAAALLAASVAAQQAKQVELEKRALQALDHEAPFQTYGFERLSFIAFDQNDPLAAAEALKVAVDLDPGSSLYWTNLGWSYYLLGFLSDSEQASLKALSIDSGEAVADYNLGLVRAVTGRLNEALNAYSDALRVNPKVDSEAIGDLERARARYPRQPAVEFALGRLYEADGQRQAARAAYQAYLDQSAADAPLRAEAQQRVTSLSAPPPPMELHGTVHLTLGKRGTAASPYHPADPVYPSFELSTPGESLPRRVTVSYQLLGGDGAELAKATEQVAIPQNAVGFVIDDLALTLPSDLTPGTFRLTVSATASDGRSVKGATGIEVAGAPVPLRQLLGRAIGMTSLDTGGALYGAADLQHPEALPGILVRELRATASEAEQALPKATSGRFKGLSGAQIFERSTAQDVSDFLAYLLASGAHDTGFTFVDAYAQWVLDGAPAKPPTTGP